ncbi:MAG: cupin domain-containing protein [Acetobacteraceae bacterium]|nr:cupin domain-containing protein [Acetobacteraceae bacterium]
MPVVNLEQKLPGFCEHWSPKIIAAFNGHDVMVVKARGGFVAFPPGHGRSFLVLKGRLTIQFRGGDVRLGPGDLHVVPKGVEHRPVADDEVHLLLMQPAGTPNTGDEATAAAKETI